MTIRNSLCNSPYTLIALTTLLATSMLANSAQAQNAKNCIELKNQAQMEQEYTDAQGKKATRLVEPTKVVPGNEVIYTMSVSNVCDKPAANVVINNPVPEQMSYVANSASGVGTDIAYSIDGKSFAKLDALTVKNADGSTRAARAEDIKAIRWTYSTAINPGQVGYVRFRARLN